jgi:hypothetical protein
VLTLRVFYKTFSLAQNSLSFILLQNATYPAFQEVPAAFRAVISILNVIRLLITAVGTLHP